MGNLTVKCPNNANQKEKIATRLYQRQSYQKSQHDQHIRDLPKIFEGQRVRVYDPDSSKWSRQLLHRDGSARGVMVIVVGNGHGDTSSNPRRD